MRKSLGLIITLVMAIAFVSGCAKKTVLKEESTPKVATTAPGKAPWEIKMEAMDKEKKAKEAAAKGAAAKPEAPAKADWEVKWEAMEKERKAKEAAAKKAAPAKGAVATSAKGLYEFADIFFDFDNFNLNDEVRAVLTKHADWLNKNKDVMVIIEGHCDERGTAEYNLALGERRADAAAKYLISMGIDSKRIVTKSYGFERPLDPRHSEEAWAKNRRAHFAVSSKSMTSAKRQ